MTSFYNVALYLSSAILNFLDGISNFIRDNSYLFLLIVPVGDIMSFIRKTPIFNNLLSLIQIR